MSTPQRMRTDDGAVFELIPQHDGRYVLAGCSGAPEGVFVEYGELIESFGAVDADDERRLRVGHLVEQRHQVFDPAEPPLAVASYTVDAARRVIRDDVDA